MLCIRSSARTDPGPRRSHNEDTYVNRPDIRLWAVADGAGGHDSGEVAAGLLRDTLLAIPAGLSEPELLSEVRHVLARFIAICARRRRGADLV